ncbi:biopolymer transport ExbB protein [Campylobacter geochelonis]|nr:MotA/TolQ/ExbB proton channel family protein [Campylobacter geochelonis]CZE46813.1 biopolymer transport ExbB protein [Campylobacter geochelonis]
MKFFMMIFLAFGLAFGDINLTNLDNLESKNVLLEQNNTQIYKQNLPNLAQNSSQISVQNKNLEKNSSSANKMQNLEKNASEIPKQNDSNLDKKSALLNLQNLENNVSGLENLLKPKEQNSTLENNVSTLEQNISQSLNQSEKNESNLAGLSFYSLYQNAHIVVKIVIYILVLFSVLTWAVFVAKSLRYLLLIKEIKADKEVLKNKTNSVNLDEFSSQSLAKALFLEIKDEFKKSNIKDNELKNRFKVRLESASSSMIQKARSFVTLLASIGSSAPFIGLFGTVWGIMNSFIGIAKADNASLAVVAPGIAEALFATAFGLVAAIPAVLFYNYLTRLGAKFANELNELITTIYLISDREIYEKRIKDDSL